MTKLTSLLFQISGLVVKKQMFAEITVHEGLSFIGGKFDGILGLAYPKFAVKNVTTVFQNMLKQKVIDKPVFSVYLNR